MVPLPVEWNTLRADNGVEVRVILVGREAYGSAAVQAQSEASIGGPGCGIPLFYNPLGHTGRRWKDPGLYCDGAGNIEWRALIARHLEPRVRRQVNAERLR